MRIRNTDPDLNAAQARWRALWQDTVDAHINDLNTWYAQGIIPDPSEKIRTIFSLPPQHFIDYYNSSSYDPNTWAKSREFQIAGEFEFDRFYRTGFFSVIDNRVYMPQGLSAGFPGMVFNSLDLTIFDSSGHVRQDILDNQSRNISYNSTMPAIRFAWITTSFTKDPINRVMVSGPLMLARMNGKTGEILQIYNPDEALWYFKGTYDGAEHNFFSSGGKLIKGGSDDFFIVADYVDGDIDGFIIPSDEAIDEIASSITTPTLSDTDIQAIEDSIRSSSLPVVVPSDYIVIGDEVPGSMVLDFHQMLVQSGTPDAENIVQGLKDLFKSMPRLMLKDWYDSSLAPQIPKDQNDAIWAAIVDLFNRANIEACKENNIAPWDYEQQKVDNYYSAQNQDKIADLQKQMDEYVAAFADPRAVDLLQQYAQLPVLGDLGFEISRQAAIKALILQGAYDEAQGIIEAFKYMSYTEFADAMTKPLPVDVVMPDGTVYTKSQ